MSDDIAFLDPYAKITKYRNRLPHWQQDNATYFVTFHLADSIPRQKREQWATERAAWLRWNPPPWTPEQEREYHRRFSGSVERWLDEMHGSCILRQPAAAEAIAAVLRHFDGDLYRHHAWIVMPNHVHALFSLLKGERIKVTLKSWKGVSSRRVNAVSARDGTLWQKDYFDRLIRDAAHFWNCARYIRRNPEKARLQNGEYLLYESEFVRTTLDGE
jgi:REP-associated tyrosine transposase